MSECKLCDGVGEITTIDRQEVPCPECISGQRNETKETLNKALDVLETARHLIDHADFRNGNTDPSGRIDEGVVLAAAVLKEVDEFLLSVGRYRWTNKEHTAIERAPK